MKLCSLILLAASSLLWTPVARAGSRPHYGGTLRIAVREAPQSLDPIGLAGAGAGNISQLIFETLVSLDQQGRPQPSLATAWQAEPGNQRWRFFLRGGVSFHDASPLDAATVVACLRNANPQWKILAAGDGVVIEAETPDPHLPVELALARNAIDRRAGDHLIGTGAFAVAGWTAGKHLTLRANDEYWGGRPYLDGIEVEFGMNDRDQMIAIDLGKIDLAEVAPENIRRARAEGREVISSKPEELMALIFSMEPHSDDALHLRNALALNLDRAAMGNVMLQGGGEAASAILPNWLSGYEFVFAPQPGAGLARQERVQAGHAPPLTFAYDSADAIAKTIAERILLNARDAGITLQLTTASNADIHLARFSLPSLDADVALLELAKALQLPLSGLAGTSVSDLYSAEKALLQSHRFIPLVHMNTAVVLRPNVRDFSMLPNGAWDLLNVWLSPEKP